MENIIPRCQSLLQRKASLEPNWQSVNKLFLSRFNTLRSLTINKSKSFFDLDSPTTQILRILLAKVEVIYLLEVRSFKKVGILIALHISTACIGTLFSVGSDIARSLTMKLIETRRSVNCYISSGPCSEVDICFCFGQFREITAAFSRRDFS